MKKFLSLVLAVSMVLMLFSCGEKQVAQTETTKTSAENSADENNDNIIKAGVLTRNTKSQEDMSKLGNKNATNVNKNIIEYHYYDDLNTALFALDRGDIDQFCGGVQTLNYIMNHNVGKYKITTSGGQWYEEYSMGALEKNKDIIDKINVALDELQESRELYYIKLKNETITDMSNDKPMPHFDNAPTYKVILTGDVPPLDYVSPDGKPIGYNVDLLMALANKLKVNFEIVTGNTASRFLMLESGKADIAFWTLKILKVDNTSDSKTNYGNLKNAYDKVKNKEEEYLVDLPKGIISTREYVIYEQGVIYLKDSKMDKYFSDKNVKLKENVDTNIDPIVGVWSGTSQVSSGSGNSTSIFKQNGEGECHLLYMDGTANVYKSKWKKDNDGKYVVDYADGTRNNYICDSSDRLTKLEDKSTKIKEFDNTNHLTSILGVWYNEEKNWMATFTADGGGFYKDNETALPFIWKNRDDGKIDVIYLRGTWENEDWTNRISTWTYDSEKDEFVSGRGTLYKRPTKSVEGMFTIYD